MLGEMLDTAIILLMAVLVGYPITLITLDALKRRLARQARPVPRRRQ